MRTNSNYNTDQTANGLAVRSAYPTEPIANNIPSPHNNDLAPTTVDNDTNGMKPFVSAEKPVVVPYVAVPYVAAPIPRPIKSTVKMDSVPIINKTTSQYSNTDSSNSAVNVTNGNKRVISLEKPVAALPFNSFERPVAATPIMSVEKRAPVMAAISVEKPVAAFAPSPFVSALKPVAVPYVAPVVSSKNTGYDQYFHSYVPSTKYTGYSDQSRYEGFEKTGNQDKNDNKKASAQKSKLMDSDPWAFGFNDFVKHNVTTQIKQIIPAEKTVAKTVESTSDNKSSVRNADSTSGNKRVVSTEKPVANDENSTSGNRGAMSSRRVNVPAEKTVAKPAASNGNGSFKYTPAYTAPSYYYGGGSGAQGVAVHSQDSGEINKFLAGMNEHHSKPKPYWNSTKDM